MGSVKRNTQSFSICNRLDLNPISLKLSFCQPQFDLKKISHKKWPIKHIMGHFLSYVRHAFQSKSSNCNDLYEPNLVVIKFWKNRTKRVLTRKSSGKNVMRKVIDNQLKIGQTDISNIQIDLSFHDNASSGVSPSLSPPLHAVKPVNKRKVNAV